MTVSERKRLQEIFYQSQFSATSHEKLSKQMKQVYEKVPLEIFLEEFTNCLKAPFIHGEKLRVVENTLNFAAKFTASFFQVKPVSPDESENVDEEEEVCPFVQKVLNFLFENHSTENQAIRFRICQFINKILNSLGNEACIDDNICDQICECMMERLQDKAPAVRMQAVLALHRLQDPCDPQCPVMKAFMFHMSTDPSAEVRRAILTNIAVTSPAARCMLERTHDIKESVRKTAYVVLSKLGVQRFTITQRVKLLADGLKDDSAIVRGTVEKVMLPAWLTFKGSFLSLLHALDCENSTEISSLALQSLFKSEPIKSVLEQMTKLLNEDKVIPVDELSPEGVLYWRVLSEYLEAHPEIAAECPIEEPLPEILPELTTFCNYIRQFLEVKLSEEAEDWVKLQHQYILMQLLELCKGFDLADEMGRTNLHNLCLYLLTNNNISEDVVPVIVQIMVKVVPNVEDRLQALAEAISEVREPMTEQEPEPEPEPGPSSHLTAEEARRRELKQASIRVQINELKEEQDKAVNDQDFLRAQNLKEEYQKLQLELKALSDTPPDPPPVARTEVRDAAKDRAALCKCLRIVREMVQSDTVKTLSATLRSLMSNFVFPCLQDDNSPIIRNKALEALGLFCLLDVVLAKENFVMFCFQIANDEVCEVALKVTFDLLHLYGLATFQIEEENNDNSTKKKSKKKKNLFVTDMYDDEFDTEEEENQESQTTISSGSSGNTSNLISMLTSLLDSASTSMRNLAMEGLYKLLMACRITSSALLSRLILMWFSPVTEGDESLRQPLAAFLSLYASHCPRSQETLEQAFLPTLRTLMQAPITSPLTQIDQDSVARLFINFTRAGANKYHSKTSHIHNNLAISICNEIMDCDDTTNIGVLLRALLQLELSLEDSVYREELRNLTTTLQQIFRTSQEKQFKRIIEKFMQSLVHVADDNTMRTTAEVDNTAATSQLGATNSLISNNSTHEQDVTKQKKKGNNARILSSHTHSPSLEDDIEDDEESQRSSAITSNIVIPPSPPQSSGEEGSEDNDEGMDSQRSPMQKRPGPVSSGEDVFKHPLEPKRNGRMRKTRNTNTREVTKKASDSESDAPSPVTKKRKADEKPAAKKPSPKVGKMPQGKKKLPRNSDGDESVIGTRSEDTNSDGSHQAVKSKEAQAMSPHSKRQIHPTEKGSSLKTFQKIMSADIQNSRIQPDQHNALTSLSPRLGDVTQKRQAASDDDNSVSKIAKTSRSSSPSKASPSLSKTRRSVSFQLESSSVDSPPESAAMLSRMQKRNVKSTKNLQEKSSSSPEAVDFEAPVPSPRQASNKSREVSGDNKKMKTIVGKASKAQKSNASDSNTTSLRRPIQRGNRLSSNSDAESSPSRPLKKKPFLSQKTSSSDADSADSPVSARRSGRISKDDAISSPAFSSSTPTTENNASELEQSPLSVGRSARPQSKKTNLPSPKPPTKPKDRALQKTSSSDADSADSPVSGRRSGRINKENASSSPAFSSTTSSTGNNASESEQSPLSVGRLARSQSRDTKKPSPKLATKPKGLPSKSSSSDIDSDGSPGPITRKHQTAVKGIVRLPVAGEKIPSRGSRRAVLNPNSKRGVSEKGTSSTEESEKTVPHSRKTRFSMSTEEESPVSASMLRKVLKKKVLKGSEKKSENLASQSMPDDSDGSGSPSPTRRQLRQDSEASPSPTRRHMRKDSTPEAATSKKGGGDSSSSGNLNSKDSSPRTLPEKVASKESQPSKKGPNKTSITKTPEAFARRSLRSASSTPSPRTRSGKIK